MPVLSSSEARALIELVAARGISQGQLGTLLGLEKSTVSRLATGLERKGWIKRGRDEANQRYIRLYLTPEGSRVAAMVWRTWQSRQARILSGLSGRERACLARPRRADPPAGRRRTARRHRPGPGRAYGAACCRSPARR